MQLKFIVVQCFCWGACTNQDLLHSHRCASQFEERARYYRNPRSCTCKKLHLIWQPIEDHRDSKLHSEQILNISYELVRTYLSIIVICSRRSAKCTSETPGQRFVQFPKSQRSLTSSQHIQLASEKAFSVWSFTICRISFESTANALEADV